MIKTMKMTQWDVNQTISVDSPAQVHFALQGSDECLIVESKDSKANVPNILLQDGRDILFWTVQEGQAKGMTKIAVSRKPKPSDYVYTETEVLSYQKLVKRLDATEEELAEIESLKNDAPQSLPSDSERLEKLEQNQLDLAEAIATLYKGGTA